MELQGKYLQVQRAHLGAKVRVLFPLVLSTHILDVHTHKINIIPQGGMPGMGAPMGVPGAPASLSSNSVQSMSQVTCYSYEYLLTLPSLSRYLELEYSNCFGFEWSYST